jgi:hypothetical protein
MRDFSWEAVSCLVRAGWVHLLEEHPLAGKLPLKHHLLKIATQYLQPDSSMDTHGFGQKAVTHASLSVAIECGRSWSQHVPQAQMDRPFDALRAKIISRVATHASIALRWQAMKALVWTVGP